MWSVMLQDRISSRTSSWETYLIIIGAQGQRSGQRNLEAE